MDLKKKKLVYASARFPFFYMVFKKSPDHFFDNSFLIKAIEFVTGWIVFVLKYLDFFLVKERNDYTLASGLYFIGSKTQVYE